MKIMDDHGRLGGRVNLLDLAAVLFLLSLTGTVSYGRAIARHRALAIVSVAPQKIAVGGEPALFVKGTGFDSGTTVRIGDNPDQPAYFDESTLRVWVGDQVLPKKYRIIVRDSRGRYAALDNAVEILWVPQITAVKPKRIYATEADLEISGKFFDQQCAVWIAGREMKEGRGGGGPTYLHKRLSDKENPLPLGTHSMTAINPGGQKGVLENAVTVLPRPQIDSIFPLQFPCKEPVELTITGKHFEPGTRVEFGGYRLGEATFVSPECLRVTITPDHCEGREYDMTLGIPDGPTVLLKRVRVTITRVTPVSLRIHFRPNPGEREKLYFLRQLPEWKTIRPSFGHMPTFPLMITAAMEKTAEGYCYSYRGQPIQANGPLAIQINGKPFSGVVVREPEVLLTEDNVRGPSG